MQPRPAECIPSLPGGQVARGQGPWGEGKAIAVGVRKVERSGRLTRTRARMAYDDGMARTTISLPDELIERLRSIALERGVPMAALIRGALEDLVASLPSKPKSIGTGASGFTDTSRRAGEERVPPRSWR